MWVGNNPQASQLMAEVEIPQQLGDWSDMEQKWIFESELQFDLANITDEIDRSKKLVETKFFDKIRIITELVGAQTKLVGIYTSQLATKRRAGSKHKVNGILATTIFNFPYRSLSILSLVRNTFYGSARIVCRQFFESLIVAKYSEYEPALVQRWNTQLDEKSDDASSIEVGPGKAFGRLESSGKNIGSLRQTWKDLCKATHPTPYSQQVLRILKIADQKEASRIFLAHTEYTLDLLLALLAMNFHLLIGHYGRKANRWWFGYLEDPFGSYDREKKLKENSKRLIREYFEKCGDRKGARGLWKRNIFEFKQSWGLRIQSSSPGPTRPILLQGSHPR